MMWCEKPMPIVLGVIRRETTDVWTVIRIRDDWSTRSVPGEV